MKFDPKYIFIITAIVCLIQVIKTLIDKGEYDGTFWIALMWVFAGVILFKSPMQSGTGKKK